MYYELFHKCKVERRGGGVVAYKANKPTHNFYYVLWFYFKCMVKRSKWGWISYKRHTKLLIIVLCIIFFKYIVKNSLGVEISTYLFVLWSYYRKNLPLIVLCIMYYLFKIHVKKKQAGGGGWVTYKNLQTYL